jgi:hypothetical protein
MRSRRLTLCPDKSGRFSENACGTPLHLPPKGLPGPVRRCMHRQASVTSKATRLKRMAPCPNYVAAFTRGNDLPRNRRNSMRLVRCKVPTNLFSHKRAESARQGGYSSPTGDEPFIPCFKDRGFLAPFLVRMHRGGTALCSLAPPHSSVVSCEYSRWLVAQGGRYSERLQEL